MRRSKSDPKPTFRWIVSGGRKTIEASNGLYTVAVWPAMGAALTQYIDVASGTDVIWNNPYGVNPGHSVLAQPMTGGSDLYDVMDGSWYVSLPNGFFPGDYFGAPLGTHGELRSLPWEVASIEAGTESLVIRFKGRSVRTPLVYHRVLTLHRGSRMMEWMETVENRSRLSLPIAWLHHPTFGGALIADARLIVPARIVAVYGKKHSTNQQLRPGYRGVWPFVPERKGGRMRDCSRVPAIGCGWDHSVQLSGLVCGSGCIWNGSLGLGFALEWDATLFPYVWSWASAGGIEQYPLWGEGHIVTLQPSTSPVGRLPDLILKRKVLRLPPRGSISTILRTGFVDAVPDSCALEPQTL